MPAAVEHPKTAQTNFRLDPETKKRGDEALALAGYTPSEAARSLWEVAASGRYRPELIHAFLSGTIAIEYDSSVRGLTKKPFLPTGKAQRSLKQSDELASRVRQLYLDAGITEEQLEAFRQEPIATDELDEADDNELLEIALYEHYLEKEKNFAPMTPEEIKEQLAKKPEGTYE